MDHFFTSAGWMEKTPKLIRPLAIMPFKSFVLGYNAMKYSDQSSGINIFGRFICDSGDFNGPNVSPATIDLPGLRGVWAGAWQD